MVKKVTTVTTVTTTTTEYIDEASKPISVYILFDRSGSMGSRVSESVGSTNAYIRALDPTTLITLVSFDDIGPFDVLRDKVSVPNYKDLTVVEVDPRGTTPLYDSTGKLFTRVEQDNPERAVIVIQTDGGENNSKEFRLNDVKNKIKNLEAKGYQIVFLGNDFGGVDNVSSSFGLASSKSLNRSAGNYDYTSSLLAGATRSYGATGQAMNFTTLEKSTAIGEAFQTPIAKPRLSTLKSRTADGSSV